MRLKSKRVWEEVVIQLGEEERAREQGTRKRGAWWWEAEAAGAGGGHQREGGGGGGGGGGGVQKDGKYYLVRLEMELEKLKSLINEAESNQRLSQIPEEGE